LIDQGGVVLYRSMTTESQLHPPSLNFCQRALDCTIEAARSAGQIMRRNLRAPKKINKITQHDLKIELDVRCQKQIEKILLSAFPDSAVLGEEGVAGHPEASLRWVVDPIDGTVNFVYGVPHACVSIALQARNPEIAIPRWRSGTAGPKDRPQRSAADTYETCVGVVYDPFCDEIWTAIRHQPSRLNGRIIQVSRRRRLDQAMVTLGLSKHPSTIKKMARLFNHLVPRVRKVRIMGAAALDIAYVAAGRFDVYLEPSVHLWDIAAAGLILESAGGEFWRESLPGYHVYRVIATNGFLRRKLPKFS
jgi:myo-inositol-1(or 4)-monophosphatase